MVYSHAGLVRLFILCNYSTFAPIAHTWFWLNIAEGSVYMQAEHPDIGHQLLTANSVSHTATEVLPQTYFIIMSNYVRFCLAFISAPMQNKHDGPKKFVHVCVNVSRGSRWYCSTRPRHGRADPDWTVVGKHLRFYASVGPHGKNEWERATEFRFREDWHHGLREQRDEKNAWNPLLWKPSVTHFL